MLDTNICSYILRRRPPEMVERFSMLSPNDLWLSCIVAAELRFGAAKKQSERLTENVERWLAGFEIKPWPTDATHPYAHIRTALENAGKPIGAMDLLIAAHALVEDAVLVTCNAAEFQRVPGLAVEVWPLS